MSRHEADFSDNPRNRMVYANWHKKTEEQRSAILKRAEALLADIEQL
jgi:deoxyribodipyrimidine photolyase-related protein